MSKETWIFDAVEEHEKKKSLPTDGGLKIVTQIGNKLISKKKDLDQQEEKLKQIKAEIREIEENELPGAMTQVGLKKFELEDGSQISVKEEIFCSIPEEKRSQALNWLEENGHSEIIKHDVKVSFAKGEYDEADRLIKVLNKEFKNIDYDEKSTVHPQTLKAFAKDRYSLGQTLPEEFFNVYEANIARVKLGKEKK